MVDVVVLDILETREETPSSGGLLEELLVKVVTIEVWCE